ncbi:hypothetical protein [Klebsiella pneumoniae]|uniref:hypothetical protein n=1 Tax=Klebsiella pneumoniae TaxID=573 RepID=UPI0022373B70|nr:hypothetical protein [Klebsiella pneumoniae]MCW6190398.1 hypothetical protein [Klebsiella pneumoniae]
MKRVLTALAATLPFAAHAADALTGEVQRQTTNWQAMIMSLIFVVLTLYITSGASNSVRVRSGFLTGGNLLAGVHPVLRMAVEYTGAAVYLAVPAQVDPQAFISEIVPCR